MIIFQQDEYVLFELDGILDRKKGSFLQQDIAAIEPTQYTTWIIDLAQVVLMDSAGLVALVSSLNSANRHECRFVLHNPPQVVGLVLEIARLDHVFEMVYSDAKSSQEIVSLLSRAKSEVLVAA
ncbi:MAG: anti-anti-sigma factor [Leptolyngbya sp.]|nr:MAG: anti-anti-sigma factor [Leptolyngbya sp.]